MGKFQELNDSIHPSSAVLATTNTEDLEIKTDENDPHNLENKWEKVYKFILLGQLSVYCPKRNYQH